MILCRRISFPQGNHIRKNACPQNKASPPSLRGTKQSGKKDLTVYLYFTDTGIIYYLCGIYHITVYKNENKIFSVHFEPCSGVRV
jgi:hypothetical protein